METRISSGLIATLTIVVVIPVSLQSGVSVENENDFRVDLHCVSSGQTTIRMEMEATHPYYHQVLPNAMLIDEVTFQVLVVQKV